MGYCEQCGRGLGAQARFCGACGSAVAAPSVPPINVGGRTVSGELANLAGVYTLGAILLFVAFLEPIKFIGTASPKS